MPPAASAATAVCGHGNTCTVETGGAHCSTATECDDGDAWTTRCSRFQRLRKLRRRRVANTAPRAADCDARRTRARPRRGATPALAAEARRWEGWHALHDGRNNCDDSNPCTSDVCGPSGSWRAHHASKAASAARPRPIAPATATPAPVENLLGGMCTRASLAQGASPCTTGEPTATDGDTCTNSKTCDGGVLRPAEGWPAASLHDDDRAATSSNPCTSDVCSASGSCELTSIAGCRRCTTAAGLRRWQRLHVPTRAPVACAGRARSQAAASSAATDGIDNDGDGKIDCQDDDCAEDHRLRPAPVENLRAHCIDNDGDGLVDYEDPDCCGTTDALTLRRMAMRMRPGPGRNTLRLRRPLRCPADEDLQPGWRRRHAPDLGPQRPGVLS